MAISTEAGIFDGLRPPETIIKVGTQPEAAGVWHSYWHQAGRPPSAAANAAGVNGQAVVPSLTTGEIERVNPSSGLAYLARLAIRANVQGTLMLIDRLWENSGLSTTSLIAQAITPATLPARDRDGTTDGHDVLAAMEWSVGGGAGTPTVTLTYTDELNNAGATCTFVGVNGPNTCAFEIFNLGAGDYGIRAPTSYIQSATRTSGTMHLVLFRVIAVLPVPVANTEAVIDAVAAGMPRIYDDSVLQLLWLPISQTLVNLSGSYVEAQG